MPLENVNPEKSLAGDRSQATTAEFSDALRDLAETGKVSLGDWHLDAKMFPHLHPFGTGSLRSEDDGCSMSEYVKSRLLLLQHEFRRSPVWSFAMMDRLIKNDLYFCESGRKRKQAMQ